MTGRRRESLAQPKPMSDQTVPQIDISVAADAWNSIEGLEGSVERAVHAAVQTANLDLKSDCEVSILLTDDRQMRALNHQWRGQDKATNVLSFPATDLAAGQGIGPLLGDIVLAYETVAKESQIQQKTVINHVSHLVIHGFLHLFGYDHENDREAALMEQLETETLARLGIDDPYEAHEKAS